jgi:hypothetical protein
METLQEKVRAHGDAGEYDQQAQAFLDGTGTVIEARYLGLQEKWNDKEPRDCYEVRIKRGSREYITEYGDSIANTEKRIAKMLGREHGYMAPRVRKGTGLYHGGYFYEMEARKWTEKAKEWGAAGTDYRPRAYSVLASITCYEPEADVDVFACEYGYTKPSEALQAHEAEKKEYAGMLSLFSDSELEALQEIS